MPRLEQAVILVGGQGSRLGALTARMPKPLLPIGDRTFLDYLLFEVARHGIKRIILAAEFESQQVTDFAAASETAKQFGLDIQISIEPERAGTGGALFHAREFLDDRFLMMNGDSWQELNLLSLATAAPDSLATLALRRAADASHCGVVELDGDRITSFRERPERPGPGLINAGVYACRKDILAFARPVCSFERDVLPEIAAAGLLHGRIADGYFIDIGLPESYARAQSEIPARRMRPAAFLDDDIIASPGVRDSIRTLNDAGFYVFAAANQPSDANVQGKEAERQAGLAQAGAHIDDVRPLDDLLAIWPVRREASFMIGHKKSALEAAARAGIAHYPFSGGDVLGFIESILASRPTLCAAG
jgi:dTDP-glucose pyrophosphorylase